MVFKNSTLVKGALSLLLSVLSLSLNGMFKSSKKFVLPVTRHIMVRAAFNNFGNTQQRMGFASLASQSSNFNENNFNKWVIGGGACGLLGAASFVATNVEHCDTDEKSKKLENQLVKELERLSYLQRTKKFEKYNAESCKEDLFEQEAEIRQNIIRLVNQKPKTFEWIFDEFKSENDCPPISVASHIYDGSEVVRFLLRNGANPNPDCQKCTLPLIKASKDNVIHHSEPKIISLLLQAGADPLKQDVVTKLTPFEYALKEADPKALREYLRFSHPFEVYGGNEPGKKIENFVKEKINNSIFGKKQLKQTALRNLLSYTYTAMLCSRDVKECIQILCDNGGDVKEVDENGNTLFHTAIKYQHRSENLKYLHSLGVSVHQKNLEGYNPLHIATQKKRLSDYDHIGTLLELGIDPNEVDNKGETPLFVYFRNSEFHRLNFSRIEQLWNVTDISIKNENDETVIDIIKQRYLKLCRDAEISIDPISLFCERDCHYRYWLSGVRSDMDLKREELINKFNKDPYYEIEELVLFLHAHGLLTEMPTWKPKKK